MANYIPTSCTDAYIKINNTYSFSPCQMQPWHSSCQQSCLTKNPVSLRCDRFFVSYFIKHKKVVWEKSQGKTHQPEQSCNPQR